MTKDSRTMPRGEDRSAQQKLDWFGPEATPRSSRKHSPGGGIVAERMRVDVLGDAGPPGGLARGVPDGLVRHRLIPTACLNAGEQPAALVLQRAVVGPKHSQPHLCFSER